MCNYCAALKVDVIEILNTLPFDHSLGFVTLFLGGFCDKKNYSKTWFDALEKHGKKPSERHREVGIGRDQAASHHSLFNAIVDVVVVRLHSKAYCFVLKALFPCFCLFGEKEKSPG